MRRLKLKQYIGLAILAAVVAVVAVQSYLTVASFEQSWRISFVRGAELPDSSGTTIDEIAAILAGDEDLVVTIEGHTGTRGDADANMTLSEDRADVVRDALVDEGVAPERILVEAHGAEEPLPQLDNEADRAYQMRLSRVDVLVAEP